MSCNSVNGWCGKPTCGRCRAVARDDRFRASFDEFDRNTQTPQTTAPSVQSPRKQNVRRRAPAHRDVVNGNRLPPATHGPGTELKKLLAELGLVPTHGCQCEDRVSKMNRGGVEWCIANRAEIESWLRKEAESVGWVRKIKAGALAVVSGLAFKIDPTNPEVGLLNEAIRRSIPAPNSPAPDRPASHPDGEAP